MNRTGFLHFQPVQLSALAKKTDGINGKLNHIWQSRHVSGDFSAKATTRLDQTDL